MNKIIRITKLMIYRTINLLSFNIDSKGVFYCEIFEDQTSYSLSYYLQWILVNVLFQLKWDICTSNTFHDTLIDYLSSI